MISLNLAKRIPQISASKMALRSSSNFKGFVETQNFINGERCKPITSTSTYENLNPAYGTSVGKFGLSNKDDVNKAVQSSLEAYEKWKDTTSSERSAILRKAALILDENKDDLAVMETIDTGKTITESGYDVDSVVEALNYFASLSYNLNGEQIPVSPKVLSYTVREPLGVCAGIGEWNFPISNIAWKTLPALICGNTFVYKPSPFTPSTSTAFAEIMSMAGLPAGVLNVVQGEGDVGAALCDHADVAKVSFTGSIATGSKVMAACAPSIKKITLEMGGKSPLIIFDDADLDNAVQGALMANYVTQGEVCSNAARVYVHEDIFDEFLKKTEHAVRNLKIGDTMDKSATIGALITQEHYDKVTGFIERAKKEGAHVVCGGEKVDFGAGSSNNNGYYLSPCLMDNCTDDMEIIREEHFGPVMCLLKFRDESDVIKRANNTNTGLSGGVFSKDISRAHRVIRKLNAGACYINTYNMYPIQIPFGGHKMSGFGSENSTTVLNHYTQLKSVYVELGDVDTIF